MSLRFLCFLRPRLASCGKVQTFSRADVRESVSETSICAGHSKKPPPYFNQLDLPERSAEILLNFAPRQAPEGHFSSPNIQT